MLRQVCVMAALVNAALGAVTLGASERCDACGGTTYSNSIGMRLALIPKGEFLMGSHETAEDVAAFFKKNYDIDVYVPGCKDERPQHRVRITDAFYLGVYSVTRGQFRQFVGDTGYKTDAENRKMQGAWAWNPAARKAAFEKSYSWRHPGFKQTDEHPVVCVSWNDATAFCKWLSNKERKQYRLPTEAEWEYACRAGTRTRYLSGEDPETLAMVGNIADASAKARGQNWDGTIRADDGYVFTAPVGKFQPNVFGLYDMHGNVRQWCADRYGATYYAESPVNDPTGPSSGGDRIQRGSSWNDGPDFARSSMRHRNVPIFRSNGLGFRVVCASPTTLYNQPDGEVNPTQRCPSPANVDCRNE